MPPIFFPTINALLNLSAAILLILGFVAIKKGDVAEHRRFMIGALCASVLFLACYLSYHAMYGSTQYEGEGLMRIVYFFILLTHTPLAVLIVPFVIAAVYYALKGDILRHTRITRWLWPTWMYVSVTGVLIYLMLYIF